MSLAGLFLITFLLVHLGLNLTLLFDKSRVPFNLAAHFMATNLLIKVFEVVLFGGILIHIFWGIKLFFENRAARPQQYYISNNSQQSVFSKYMIHTGVVILAFLILHLMDFWFKAKFIGGMPTTLIDGREYEDMGLLVVEKFKSPIFAAIYVGFLFLLGFHLDHAFQSALQSIGLNHSKYTPFFKVFSRILAIVISIGFIAIPVVVYFTF